MAVSIKKIGPGVYKIADQRMDNPNPPRMMVRNSMPMKVQRTKAQQTKLNRLRKTKKGQVDDLPDYFLNGPV